MVRRMIRIHARSKRDGVCPYERARLLIKYSIQSGARIPSIRRIRQNDHMILIKDVIDIDL